MKYQVKIKTLVLLLFTILLMTSQNQLSSNANTFSLTAVANGLRNSDGVVVFALYNRSDAFPDENFQKYFKILTGKIVNNTSTVKFSNLLPGKYAVNILHDEDKDGKIKKGFLLPKEGIGFSNYESINLMNRPNFSKASFDLFSDQTMKIKIIYM
jgi:uncharacterized protein (DUF2141 family)